MGKIVKIDTSDWTKCGNMYSTGEVPTCKHLKYSPLLGCYKCLKYDGVLYSANGYVDVKRCERCLLEKSYCR